MRQMTFYEWRLTNYNGTLDEYLCYLSEHGKNRVSFASADAIVVSQISGGHHGITKLFTR